MLNTSIPCPITVQKSCYQNFAGCRCTGGALIFHPTYIRMICYYQFGMQNQLLLLTPHKIRRDRNDTAMANRYPNVFRTARFIPAVEYLTACRVTWLCSRLFIERVRYYHCAQYGRRTYGANMPQAIPVSRYQLV
jgi:hypothetical protein